MAIASSTPFVTETPSLTQRVLGVNQRRTAGLPPSSKNVAQKAETVSVGVGMAVPFKMI
jgi:hypothetical protein